MSKQASIASLIRVAARSEEEFVETIQEVFAEKDIERIAEFFDRMNIPRSQGTDMELDAPLPEVVGPETTFIWDFETEARISEGMQKVVRRHERKIKWHSGHPSVEGAENVVLVFRAAMIVTNLRLARLRHLLQSKDELTPAEWSIARRIMNDSFLSFRNYLNLLAGPWSDAVSLVSEDNSLMERIGKFYEQIDRQVTRLESEKDKLEERRRELTVLPEGFLPVKPPIYFRGDLLERGPWKLYWGRINSQAHVFREFAG